jgi:hypothetical protein
MRTIFTFVTALSAASLLSLVPASAGSGRNLNETYAQATGTPTHSTAQKPKRKRAPKVEYMRAVPYR